jgi:hypothetical protein
MTKLEHGLAVGSRVTVVEADETATPGGFASWECSVTDLLSAQFAAYHEPTNQVFILFYDNAKNEPDLSWKILK